jgi:GTP-binding protein
VLRKALEARLPVILVVNKVDRPDARIEAVVNEVYELFLDLDADESQIEFPIVYCNAKAGRASLEADPDGLDEDLRPLLDLILERIPPPAYADDHPLQALVTNLDASPYVGRLALCRVAQGTIRRNQQVAWCRASGAVERARITELYVTEALDRVEADEAGPGEIIAVAGLPDVTIGETLADPDDPRPLPVIAVDEPSLSMTIGINTSPLAGLSGDKLTASLLEGRLRTELVGNVSLRVLPTESPDAWEVQGRGELQLAVLVEQMRREGFELTVGKPQVVTREIDGKVHEPVERVSVDAPEEYLGVLTQLFALRKGRTESLVNHGSGWVRMDVIVPARGLIGFRTEFLTETRGTGILHHVFESFEPWFGELRTRPTGALVADRRGRTTSNAILNLQERGSLFVAPGVDVYEGMIVGENSRAEDLDVNATKEKKLTNTRSAAADATVRLIPPRPLSLDQALEYIREDECVEVTPSDIRLRKLELSAQRRQTAASRKARGLAPVCVSRRGEPPGAGSPQSGFVATVLNGAWRQLRPQACECSSGLERDGLQLVQPVDPGQRREELPPDSGHDHGRHAAEDDRRNGADERRGDARFECAELVRRADEHHLDRGDATAELVRRQERQDRRAQDDADRVQRRAEREREHREPHRAREPEGDHAHPEPRDHDEQLRPRAALNRVARDHER